MPSPATPRRRGPMGGPHGGMMMPGEKPKDFKKTLGKLIRYMRASLPVLIVSFVLAIASVILTLNIPNILGEATDTLIGGVLQKQIYASLEDELPAMYGVSTIEEALEKAAEAYNAATGASRTKYDITLGDLAELSGSEAAPGGSGSVAEKYLDGVMGMVLYETPQIDINAILRILTLMIVLVCASGALTYVQSFLLAGVAQKISYRFRRDIDLKISRLPLKFYDTVSNGEVLSILTNDVDNISTTLNQSLAQLVTSVTTLVGVLVMMLRISWILTIIPVVIVPVSLLLVMLVVKHSQKHFVRQQNYLGDVNGHIEEMYGAHQVIDLFNAQEESRAKFAAYNDKLAVSARKSQFLSGLMQPIMQFIGNIGYVLTCIVGGVLVVNGGLGVGNIQAFIQYIRQFNQPVAQFGNIMNTLQLTVASAERVFDFLEAEEEKETGDKVPENVRGNVTFKNVRFGYDPDKIIIHDFSADVSAGRRVAIVGPTGAGKTTMVKLLMRYYELNGGAICLDGQDITSFNREKLRDEFGMVLQDTWLFSGTIMENIRYGRLDATDDEVRAAAVTACADHFIRTLEGGYNFEINEEADNISQGQKQLLTIARAVLADPKVLILDEATSSVDTRTEVLIQRAMNRLMEGRTSFIIAHRLSTIRDADLILVMRDGDIVEQGNHEALMERGGFYATLYNSQFS